MSSESGFFVEDGAISWFDGFDGLDGRVLEAFEEMVPEVVGYAKSNAPWEDRTGAARDGLDAAVYNDDGEVTLDLFHTVDHGYWLEIIQSGRFAIIMPTLEAMAPEVFRRAGGTVASTEAGDL